MKKLLLIFILCSMTLYGLMFCYANEQSIIFDISKDLPLVVSYETAEGIKQLNENSTALQSAIAEQRMNINTLNSVYYLGSYTGSFNGSSLQQSLKWNSVMPDKAPLFNSEIYSGYYNARASKILKQYQYSESFDYAAFIETARPEFDSYIKTAVKNQKSKEQLIILLQEKLFDKLTELEPNPKKKLFEEVLALRLPANNSKFIDSLYQQFEGRVRLQLLTEMVQINQQKLKTLTNKVGMIITSDKKGQLQLQYKDYENEDSTVQIINVLEGSNGYRGLANLDDLYGKSDCRLVFSEEGGSSYGIDLDQAISVIALDKEGYVQLNLDNLLAEKETQKAKAEANKLNTGISDERFKSIELLYSSKTEAVQEIIRELNRYSMYLELKDNKISNFYTRSFEAEQKTWKKNLEIKLNSFGPSGTADFMSYIKQFSLLDRNPNKQDRERILIAKFRNSDIQFRKTEDSCVWITDIFYRLRQMQ